LKDLPREEIRNIIVVDNGSIDLTAKIAKEAGAIVLHQPERGYGAACLLGMDWLAKQELKSDIVCFLDADYSDFPEELSLLTAPIIAGNADLVIGSRALGKAEKGAMQPQQIFGNWLATRLLNLFYSVRFTDLGPFRAISYQSLLAINMKDRNYGWTVEMQLKAAKNKMRCMEIPVSYRNRIGTSKVSGTIKGSVLAGYKILYTIFRYL
jgi:glycosyltransferase involved in cell wall biosynthesis